MIKKQFHCKVYDAYVMLLADCSDETFNEYAKEQGLEPMDFDCRGCVDSFKKDNKFTVVMWIKNLNDPKALGTLAHETFHLVDVILTDRLVKLEPDTEEAWAYYYDSWFCRLYDVIFKEPLRKRAGKKQNRRKK